MDINGSEQARTSFLGPGWKKGSGQMKRWISIAGMGGYLLTAALILPTAVTAAGDLVANPETVFAKGMSWTERNGQDKGVMQLNANGSAIVNWNGRTYYGSWEKVDDYRVKTTWEDGGPGGSVWSLRETGDGAVPYRASRRAP